MNIAIKKPNVSLMTAAILASFVIFASYSIFTISTLKKNINASSKIIVVDRLFLVSGILDGKSDQESIAASHQLITDAINKFVDAGYVVIDQKNVLGAPISHILTQDDIKAFLSTSQEI